MLDKVKQDKIKFNKYCIDQRDLYDRGIYGTSGISGDRYPDWFYKLTDGEMLEYKQMWRDEIDTETFENQMKEKYK